jgi:2-polyprenyl-3-methyl-5-hydroxy-6-metoxy-1,4-benzoquinol methylase
MVFNLPNPKYLKKTSEMDYYHWNYQFPFKYIQRYYFRAIIDLLGKICHDKLLEVGTGSGIFLSELSKHCRKLYACDIHGHMDDVQDFCRPIRLQVSLRHCSIPGKNSSGLLFL